MSDDTPTTGGIDTDERHTDDNMVTQEQPFGLPRWVVAIVPLVLLAVVLAYLFFGSPFAALATGGSALPDVTVSYTTLPNEETVLLHVTNNGPRTVTVEQVLVNDAYWSFQMSDGDRTLRPLESATIEIPYHWTPGWDLHTTLVLSDGATIHHTILAPSTSPGVTGEIIGTLAVVGLFVGVIPVVLGMLWLPYLRTVSDRALHAVLVFAVGVLAFLGFDALVDVGEFMESVPGAYEGPFLFALGVAGSLLVIQGFNEWQRSRTDGETSRLRTAYLVAVSIGLHNLAEGLAIGTAFALGRVELGAFLVVGFLVHNVTEGPAIVGPLARGNRPGIKHFVALGLIGGAPVILGAWIGSYAFSPTLGVFFLAIGLGAILQVVWELADLIRGDDSLASLGTPVNAAAFLFGAVFMYVTGLFIAL
jgi:ZIP family zinc transporter